MEPIGAVFAVGILLLLVLPPLYSRTARIQRALRRARPCTTASFDERSVGKLRGTVRCVNEPLRAPLSGRPCAYYEVVIEVLTSLDGSVRNVARAQGGRDFLVQDAHGVALVKLPRAQVLAADSFAPGPGGPAPGALAAFLLRNVAPARHWSLDHPIRCRERIVAEGDPVVVCGRGTREPDPDPHAVRGDYRARATRLVMSASDRAPLYVSNHRRIVEWMHA